MPATVMFNALPKDISEDLLATFSEESRHWRTSSRFIYDKKIIRERLATGLYIPDLAEASRGGKDASRWKRWETTGFMDLIRAAKGLTATESHRLES